MTDGSVSGCSSIGDGVTGYSSIGDGVSSTAHADGYHDEVFDVEESLSGLGAMPKLGMGMKKAVSESYNINHGAVGDDGQHQYNR